MTVSIPIKLQQYLIKKINFDTITEMIQHFPCYLTDIEQIIYSKIKHCSKQMSKREDNIRQIMKSIQIADTQRSEQSEYELIYESFVKALLLEYRNYKKSKRAFINLTLLQHGEAYWQG